MAVILEKPELRIYEIRKRQHRKRIITLIILALIAAVIALGGAFYTISNKRYTEYEVIKSIQKSDTGSAKYYTYGSGYLRVSRDGIMAADSSGSQLWNDTYQMKDPQVSVNGGYVSVSDRGSKQLNIYGPKGLESSNEMNYPIIKSVIASQGVTAVLLSGKGENHINYYAKEGGKEIVNRRTTEKEDGFPVDISISKDGTKLVTSYVFFSKGELSNKITFFNFGGVGDSYIDKIVGADAYGTTLIPDVEFVNNNTVCAFGDNMFTIYKMEETPEAKVKKELDSKVKTIFYNESYIGLVLEDADNIDSSRIVVYDLDGNIVFRKNTDFSYSTISLKGEEIVLNSSRDWLIYQLNGKVRMTSHFEKEIAQILPAPGRNRYIMINDETIDEVKLK
ncbi:DUF5711 family protein [Anaerocolumna sp. AGMB13020]|uniref:DUF5711 family protein n=1 Tax=Anaerocolumna sp. AGMB13020 TaxID=3081750 RepID=UPI002953B00A|nr:DUF5711 family protein [Anaerocolumna sp. AGMB13020]WOO39100.1 DUF5711 family protein [Anaerocolumna sp. AGMB13020]